MLQVQDMHFSFHGQILLKLGRGLLVVLAKPLVDFLLACMAQASYFSLGKRNTEYVSKC